MVKNNSSQVALISGTSKGLGKHIAEHLLGKEYRVFGCSRSPSSIENPNYTHFETDISEESSIVKIFKQIKSEESRLDILINNAVLNPPLFSSVFLTQKMLEDSFKVNLFAPMIFSREAIKIMSRKKFGRIINIGSIVTKHEVGGSAIYNSAKNGLLAYSSFLSKEIIKLGITVNVVSPSVMESSLSESANQEKLNQLLSRCAINSLGKFDDVINVIDFLIGKESGAITGQNIFLGGA